MAVITFIFVKDGIAHRRTQGAVYDEKRMGWEIAGGFVPDRMVVEIKRTNTMRKHCFYCWKDAEKFNGEVEVCGIDHPGDVELLHKWKPGMYDDPVEA